MDYLEEHESGEARHTQGFRKVVGALSLSLCLSLSLSRSLSLKPVTLSVGIVGTPFAPTVLTTDP